LSIEVIEMESCILRYDVTREIPIEEVEATIVIVLATLESLHGEAQVQLAAPYFLDLDQRACVVDTSTDVGRDFSRVFLGLLRREFGDNAFRVRRIAASPATAVAA
jgi:hypothetical protein